MSAPTFRGYVLSKLASVDSRRSASAFSYFCARSSAAGVAYAGHRSKGFAKYFSARRAMYARIEMVVVRHELS